ncbi:hypothetical protein PROFUN_11203 [Planoprotostelium fungivorum]|uniref:Uncharacterized protein n=1 Tax=Planoprotostelium fungivorum TaxID=1890364 RepID=A0A2P6NAY0_9EUKA|nr:hypothetical protein PROFUN_11203 [Planoprotostelium fungivorum]
MSGDHEGNRCLLPRQERESCGLSHYFVSATESKTKRMPKPSYDCTKCSKRTTVHRTKVCEVCRSNAPEYKARKKQWEMSDKGKRRRKAKSTMIDFEEVEALTRLSQMRDTTARPQQSSFSADNTPPGTPIEHTDFAHTKGLKHDTDRKDLEQGAWESAYLDKSKSHVMDFLAYRGMLPPGAAMEPTFVELQEYLRHLLNLYPHDDLVVGTTPREVNITSFLLLLTRRIRLLTSSCSSSHDATFKISDG